MIDKSEARNITMSVVLCMVFIFHFVGLNVVVIKCSFLFIC